MWREYIEDEKADGRRESARRAPGGGPALGRSWRRERGPSAGGVPRQRGLLSVRLGRPRTGRASSRMDSEREVRPVPRWTRRDLGQAAAVVGR